MKYLNKTLILIAGTLAHLLFYPSFSYPQPAEIDSKLISDSCHQMRDLFVETLLAYNVPGGMVVFYNSDCKGVSSFRERIQETDSLSKRLDLLVEAVQGYRWLERNGVINLEPRDIEARLLDTQVRRFAYYNTNSNLNSMMHSLEDTSEVRLAMDGLKLRSGPYYGGLQSPPSKTAGTAVVLHNKSVREILNDVVQRRGRGLWVYSEQLIDHSHRFTLQFVIK